MQLRSALLAATFVAMPLVASAQPVTGLYVGLGAGVNVMSQEQVKNLSFPTLAPLGSGLSTSGHVNGSTGFAGVVSMGWGFGNGLRAEIEGDYRDNHLTGLSGFTTATSLNGGTNEQKYGGMVNVLYDFNGLTPWFVPYVGAGVGYQGIDEKFHAGNTAAYTWHCSGSGPASGCERRQHPGVVCLPGDRGHGVPAAADHSWSCGDSRVSLHGDDRKSEL